MALMGIREYARHRNVRHRAVQKAIESGRIETVLVDGARKIDQAAADKSWLENTDPARSQVNAAVQLPLAALPDDDDGDDAGGDALPSGRSQVDIETTRKYNENRAARAQIQREREQMEFDRERGQLINVDEAIRIASTVFRGLRDDLLNMPARLKDELAAEPDAGRCEDLLERELEAILGGIDAEKLLTESEEE